ncbi:hypothetical protein [Acidisphaera rubrifaciens]|uniref:Uncharacterized protein n=1 Tax=Acidisphaera rubrifaciens HS-AP3 TaxID=1231350 RepID=A0A0D6P3U6_9PROT|nr:hypothetical protein [Acidisphaera rubrifaciens]GAN76322.1 hypothetical protein Asru_0085_09 [Acidisphaera rubrifaciens HS-AP3]
MIQLILVFCLSAGGASCKEVHPMMDGLDTPDACMRSAEIVAIDELHTRLDLQGYQLASWRCIIGGHDERAL